MDKELFKKIFNAHKKTIKYLDVANPTKLVIAFSGVPASGKTTIAKILEKRYKAIRINNDQIRKIITEETGIEIVREVQTLVVEYAKLMRKELTNFLNHIIILDSSIDRNYKYISAFYEPEKYKLFIIKLDILREEIERRIRKRNNNNPDIF